MDFTSLAIGMFLLGLCIAPFAIIALKKKNKKHTYTSALKNKAKEVNAELGHLSIWDNKAIAIDEESGLIITLTESSESLNINVINLGELVSCSINRTNRIFTRSNGQDDYTIDNLSLNFNFSDLKKETFSFEFYNSDNSRKIIADELELIETWNNNINSWLNKDQQVYKKIISEPFQKAVS